MVSTRNHPRQFPPPNLSASPTSSPSKSNALTTSSKARKSGVWAHQPPFLAVLWLLVSVPIVIWDTGYMLGRPYTMPGGAWHAPIWSPYTLYATVDYIYGFPAWEEHNGFSGAQSSMNVVETLGYIVYLVYLFRLTESAGRSRKGAVGVLERLQTLRVGGRAGGGLVLLALCTSVMTLSKSVLYWLNEYFSGYRNVGHNDTATLFFIWAIPNGLWLIFPTYMTYVFSVEALRAFDATSPKKD
ncbi:hypothetical protein P152DRAFT_388678 [Eremomyces bilateralis CBS 781.70]|uniref:Emopamil-binding protein n=1 Tax=Eremomyces bilateralis CBS 781.70 TaxID=1392243 RepID=A0A6G1GDL3_9PEZI|nr:uncharacterized protein P152DRAFT_388678 [Eremomyces bilateralis CBS 781.70]KAF1816104.1 hypothetical protein P152DRAFT_388678 [Eremomyces bilateralis CBS 781.70]